MHRTMFDTPIVNTVLRWCSLATLKLLGWRVEGQWPADLKKCVIIAAPHTSNWDLLFALMMAFSFRVNIYWMGKEQIFRQPFRALAMWLGGIPIDRSKSNNIVAGSILSFEEQDRLFLMVPPEGTRAKVSYWKTGFYHIAHGAKVPILLSYLDFQHKVGGLGPCFNPSGDIDKDMQEIQAFYSKFSGKRAGLFHSDK